MYLFENETPRIIAFVGNKACGKSHIAKTVAKLLRYNGERDKNSSKPAYADVNILQFASPIRYMAAALGVPYENMNGTDDQKNESLEHLCGATGRKILQTLGTEWGREAIHPEIWVNLMAKKLDTILNDDLVFHPQYCLIDDMRFLNEADMIKEKNGIVVRVKNNNLANSDNHKSENELNQIKQDITIDNTNHIDENSVYEIFKNEGYIL